MYADHFVLLLSVALFGSRIVEAQAPDCPIKVSTSATSFTPTGTPSPTLGITYTLKPDDGKTCLSQSAIEEHFDLMGDYSLVRIYDTECITTVVKAAIAKGKSLFVGINPPRGVVDISRLLGDVNLIKSATGNTWQPITTIAIGNEMVFGGEISAGDIVGLVREARVRLKTMNFTGDVVTVDAADAYGAHPELCNATEPGRPLAVNCQIFFDSNCEAYKASTCLSRMVSRVQSICPNHDVRVTEVGWPTNGIVNGKAVPSLDAQIQAIKSLRESGKPMILFSAFDEGWKPDNEFGVEHHWGILGPTSSS